MPSLFLPAGVTPAALALLLDAFEIAADGGLLRWKLAARWRTLRRAGCTDAGLEWLLAKKYAEHALETTLPFDRKRTFRPLTPPWFHRRSRFALTEAGAAFARQICHKTTSSTDGPRSAAPKHPDSSSAKPHWDVAHRQLMVGNRVVKRFKRPARNQELILAAFQEEDWPERIDDPIPGIHGKSAWRRLHDAIKALNHNQTKPGVHFYGDGSGRGVRWQHGVSEASKGSQVDSDDG
jgi:hypothetical protein